MSNSCFILVADPKKRVCFAQANANALKWKHVEKNRIYICEAVATDVRIRKTTKTDTPRYFPINEELRAVFDAVRPENPDPNALVFPA